MPPNKARPNASIPILLLVGCGLLWFVFWTVFSGPLSDWITVHFAALLGVKPAQVLAMITAYTGPTAAALLGGFLIWKAATSHAMSTLELGNSAPDYVLPRNMISFRDAAVAVFERTDAADIAGLMDTTEDDRLLYHAEQLKIFAEEGKLLLHGRKLPSTILVKISRDFLRHGDFDRDYSVWSSTASGEFHSLCIRRRDLRRAVRLVRSQIQELEVWKANNRAQPKTVSADAVDSSEWTGRGH